MGGAGDVGGKGGLDLAVQLSDWGKHIKYVWRQMGHDGTRVCAHVGGCRFG